MYKKILSIFIIFFLISCEEFYNFEALGVPVAEGSPQDGISVIGASATYSKCFFLW